MGCDFPGMYNHAKKDWFQSTHPHGVRQYSQSSRCSVFCFNPRTRMGCDSLVNACSVIRLVSIHAPAWGATRLGLSDITLERGFNPRTRMGCDRKRLEDYTNHFVSIHAPAWGATQGGHTLTPPYQVSIHAPAWGATQSTAVEPYRRPVSIHAPAWGATSDKSERVKDVFLFQSTHPHGVRQDRRAV